MKNIVGDFRSETRPDGTDVYFGLPHDIEFCDRCVLSNQRPCSYPEFKHTRDRDTPTVNINKYDVCDPCKYDEMKEGSIDWDKRESELLSLLDKHRSNDGSYDCILPGSGGKDSSLASHILEDKYDMNPLTVTWPPTIYTKYGRENFENWIEQTHLDNITFKPNGKTHRLLTQLSVENLLHPFQTFILGQKNLAAKVAERYDIPLVFFGENEAEYGNPIADNADSLRDDSYHTYDNLSELYFGGEPIPKLQEEYGLSLGDLKPYLPIEHDKLVDSNIEVHYLGYYLNWTPQEAYYYAVENTGFKARPFRTEGTYSKYNSIDDKIDDLHYYTTFIKFGIGRATYDASQEIRNNHITRNEAVKLVSRFDGEYPTEYLDECLDYLDMTEEYFVDLCNSFRSPHIWKRSGNEWKLRKAVWHDNS